VKEAGLLMERPAASAGAKARAAAPPVSAADLNSIKTGTRVRHGRFGEGTVMYTSGSGDKLKAKVRFKTGRAMLLMVSAAPLEILK
jgi:hypothetical protein